MNLSLPNVITADCPWPFSDKLPGKTRGAAKQYRTLEIDQLRRLKVPPHSPDCILFFWRVAAMPEEAFDVLRFWGFTPKTEMVWLKSTKPLPENADVNGLVNGQLPVGVKVKFGMGRYTRGAHESLIIAAKGKAIRHVHNRSIRSVFVDQVRGHSEKPERFYRIVESMTKGPILALFEREERGGRWQCFGDEIDSRIPIFKNYTEGQRKLAAKLAKRFHLPPVEPRPVYTGA